MSSRSTDFAGILYPSLGMHANADNVALLPEFANKYLEFEQVEFIRVDSDQHDFQYQITVLDFANSVDDHGGIEWKGRRPRWQIEAIGQITFVAENGRWIARDELGNILDPN